LIQQLRTMTGLLGTKEVCDLLGVSKLGLHKWTKRGVIPHFRLGDRLKFDPQVLASWLGEREVV
jgi:excisionase family DNA binding protein